MFSPNTDKHVVGFFKSVSANSGGGQEGRGKTAALGGSFAGAAFKGRKFGILAFALQCVSVSFYLFFIYSVH